MTKLQLQEKIKRQAHEIKQLHFYRSREYDATLKEFVELLATESPVTAAHAICAVMKRQRKISFERVQKYSVNYKEMMGRKRKIRELEAEIEALKAEKEVLD